MPTGVIATVRRTGQAARVDDLRRVAGGARKRREGLRSAVAVPVHVNGRLWEAIDVDTGRVQLQPDTEQRMTEFTDVVATAVANAQNRDSLEAGRDELARLLEEQAALHRVATLVARGIDPVEIFLAVAEEVRRLLGADGAGIARFGPDGASVVAVSDGVGGVQVNFAVGTRVKIRAYLAPAVGLGAGRSPPAVVGLWGRGGG